MIHSEEQRSRIEQAYGLMIQAQALLRESSELRGHHQLNETEQVLLGQGEQALERAAGKLEKMAEASCYRLRMAPEAPPHVSTQSDALRLALSVPAGKVLRIPMGPRHRVEVRRVIKGGQNGDWYHLTDWHERGGEWTGRHRNSGVLHRHKGAVNHHLRQAADPATPIHLYEDDR